MILATNDDGIGSIGLRHLVDILDELDEVYVVAPEGEQSGVGMAITIDRPLRAKEAGDRRFSVDGTPVDCVDLAVGRLLPSAPDLIVSGINLGQNVGHDVHYSGTVAAARKGVFLGIPSIAVSLAYGEPWRWETAVETARRVVKTSVATGIPSGVLLNVNVPSVVPGDVRGTRVVAQDPAPYDTHVLTRNDKWGRPYHWIGGKRLEAPNREDTDVGAVEAGYVAITPLHADMTCYDAMAEIAAWGFDD